MTRRGGSGKTATETADLACRSMNAPAVGSDPITAMCWAAASKSRSSAAAWNDSPAKSLRPGRFGIHGMNGDSQAITARARRASPLGMASVQVSVSSSNTAPITSRSTITKSVTPPSRNAAAVRCATEPAPTTTTSGQRCVTGIWCVSSRDARSGPSNRPRSETRPAEQSPPPGLRGDVDCCVQRCGPAGRPDPCAHTGSGC